MARGFVARFVLAGLALGAWVPVATAQETEVRYLSGTDKDHTVPWEFMVSAGRRAGEWTTIPVPSNWELQGFGTYSYGQEKNKPFEEGRYRHRFDVPASWKGKRVFIRFEGAMTDTEVLVNGKPAGPVHRGGFYEFRHEVTSLVLPGRSNLLEVTVREQSSNASINRAERDGDFWVFGGIFRPVRLEAVPAAFIDRVAIDARADGAFRAEVHVDGVTTASRVIARVEALDGFLVGQPLDATVEAGASRVSLSGRFDGVRTWNAETPNLYRVSFHLAREGRTLHAITERFGFRTVEVRRGEGLYVNGRRVLLKGVNRHSFWPESGRTTSREISVADATLLKEMNANAVRMSHYPPDRHFLDVCDELGLYVIDELTGWQAAYDDEAGVPLVPELVRRDANHPSVIFWANGNEGGWNTNLDDDFAPEDPQGRVVIHPWDAFNGIDTLHYAPYDCCAGKFFHGTDLIMPTEFNHGLYDGGLGAGLKDYWSLIARHPLGVGGFLWVFADEGIVRTDSDGAIDAHGNYGADGIVGPHREKEASYFTIRSLWSPVAIDVADLPPAFDGRLPVENRYAFTDLAVCAITWQLLDFEGPGSAAGHRIALSGRGALPPLAPGARGVLDLGLPARWREHDALSVTATDPAGRVLDTWRWMLRTPGEVSRRIVTGGGPVTARETDATLTVSAAGFEFSFDRATGRLAGVRAGGQPVSFGNGPRTTTGEARLTSFAHHADGEGLVVEATYDGVLRRVRWRVRGSGWLSLDYQLRMPGGQHPFFGVTFDYPADQVTGLTWLGRGPYRVWKNRLDGMTFDVWSNARNDGVTGAVWQYPEFAGYFADLYWATVGTREQPITIASGTPGLFLRVLTPRFGDDPRFTAVAFPEGDISILHAIPPIGTKFHPASVYGPQSQLNLVNGRTGTYEGTLHFKFGTP